LKELCIGGPLIGDNGELTADAMLFLKSALPRVEINVGEL
jgi:hypothetical protein